MDKQDAEAQPTQLEVERHRLVGQLHLPIERLPLAYMLFDTNYRVLDCNPTAEKIFGYSKEEIVGRVALELIVPLPVGDHLQEILRRIQSGDMDAHSVNDNRTKDGRIITCEWHNTPLIDPDGQFAGVISLAQDITERKRTEQALRESEEQVTRTYQSISDGLVTVDRAWRYIYVNAQAERMLGRSRADLIGKCVWEEFPFVVGREDERQLRRAAR